MIPQARTNLRRDRTPNRKYIENNLYEIHKRLKHNENKPISKNIKPPKSTEKSASPPKISKKLRSVKNIPNGFSNFKLAPAKFITSIQRAHKSVDFQRGQILDLELDSNQNIVDQLNFPKSRGNFTISTKKNDKTKFRMASDVLFALGLVPASINSNSDKMHLLEDEEEEGGGGGRRPHLKVTKTEGGGATTDLMTSSLLRNKNGGVTSGDLPETPPSDMDEEMKEEELTDIITVPNGMPATDPLQQDAEEDPSTKGDTTAEDTEDGKQDTTEDEGKKSNGDVEDAEESRTTGDKEDLTATEKSDHTSLTPTDENKETGDQARTVEETGESLQETIKPLRRNSTADRQKEKENSENASNCAQNPEKAKGERETKDSNTNLAEKDTSDKDETEEESKESDSAKDTEESIDKGKDTTEQQSMVNTQEDIQVATADAAKNEDSKEEEEEEGGESGEDDLLENTLDEKDGILTIGGKVVEIAPPPPEAPPPASPEDKQSLSELMLTNNIEISICKTPEMGHLRRSSSSSNGSGVVRSLSPSIDHSLNEIASNVSLHGRRSSHCVQSGAGKTSTGGSKLFLEDRTSSPALSADGSAGHSVSEAELMLATVSDGEITITKSCPNLDVSGKPSGSVEGSGKSELRMMRRADLKRSLSSEVWTGGVESGGDADEVLESKRAHLSRSEEVGEDSMVTEEYEPDLTEPLEGDEDERERLVRDFVTSASSCLAEVQTNCSKLKREIHVLSELAQAKELEWNSILRLKKLKEEMWERLSRKVRMDSLFSNKRRPSTSTSPSLAKCSKPSPSPSPSSSSSQSSSLKSQRLILPKPSGQPGQQPSPIPSPNTEIVLAEGRQGKIKDVQAIINDYRSKSANEGSSHHSSQASKVRSRRSSLNSGATAVTNIVARSYAGNPSLLSMANLALGSGGGQVRSSGPSQQQQLIQQQIINQQQLDVQLNYLSNVQVQRHSQMKPQSMPLPPVAQSQFPEVTLHPVLPSPTQQQNSLLHGILTKTNAGKHQQQTTPSSHPPAPLPPHMGNARSTSFSPTLARLLTAPERQRAAGSSHLTGSPAPAPPPGGTFSASQNLSAMLRAQKIRAGTGGGPPCSNDIVASLKQKIVPQQIRHQQQQQQSQLQSEITITPVSCVQMSRKDDSVVNVEDEDENDRLVIDETRTGDAAAGATATPGGAASGLSNGGESIPECQGCHRSSAQFVCAGCGNQWYCSRECQVAAWEDHSDVCSG